MYDQASPLSIQQLFSKIAKRYDRANLFISLGSYKLWNRALIREFKGLSPLLDLCAGTGAIATSFLQKNPEAKALLVDFCPEMLAIAKTKCERFGSRASLHVGDAMALPLPDAHVSAITLAYGIRNIQEPERCFHEAYRVLRPGGLFGILELTRPASPLLAQAHSLYLRTALPLIGKWIAREREAYSYLARTIENFTSPAILEELLQKAHFSAVWRRPLFGGIATLIFARK